MGRRLTRGDICRFIAAVRIQPQTADDLSARTDMGIDSTRRWLREMERAGMVRISGRAGRRGGNGVAPMLWEWKP